MKKEIGKWMLDIAKYMATAILLSTLFSNSEKWTWFTYLIVVLLICMAFGVGLLLIKEEKKI